MYKEKAVDYFDRHPSSDECHITSDGRVFHSVGTAQGFATGLKDNKIESYKRSDLDVKNIDVNDLTEETGGTGGDTGDGNTGSGSDDTGAGTGDDLGAANPNIEALKAFDSTTAKYEDGKDLVKALGIETPSNSKVDIFAALDAAKANLEPQA